MERNWSEAARSALDIYPWRSEKDKLKAKAEAEMVSFGAEVEVADLPLAVRRFIRGKGTSRRFEWKGETWAEISAEFEREIFAQVLEKTDGRTAAAARLLKTTPRVVSYAARKYGLAAVHRKSLKTNKTIKAKGK